MWVVRAGRGAELAEAFVRDGMVAIGGLRNLHELKTLDEVRSEWEQKHPGHSASKAGSHAGQSHRFANVMATGDDVVTFDRATRLYHLGTITGEPRFEAGVMGGAGHDGTVRSVAWASTVSRDDLPAGTRNSLGYIGTVFQPSEEAIEELRALAEGRPSAIKAKPPAEAEADEHEELAELREDMEARSIELITDAIAKLDWSQMQDLVAAILRAMGYKTRVSGPGSDRGKDIIASPDGLGFQSPRIKVEVKHRKGSMGAPEIRSFLGGLRKDDRGLYVSTGGFTNEARYEAERAEVPTTLIDLDGLAELLVQHYKSVDDEGRALVPLQPLYWPVR